MKSILLLSLTTATLHSGFGQEFRVGEKGLHHRIWERTVEFRDHRGRAVQEKSSYTELATGLMYEENGQLLESSEAIELFNGGAVARRGQHKVIFPANLNSPEGIDYESIDKQRFRSQPMGLSYYEATTGRSVLIGEIKDCEGVLHAPNRVVYSDALTDIKAEVRYTYRRGGFAQDVILLESPPPPEEYGLDPAACRLEIFTEFAQAAAPTRRVRSRVPAKRPGQPEATDEELHFGQMRVGVGKAFVEERPGSVRVAKLWTLIDGRQFLVESVDYLSTKPLLDVLPPAGVAAIQKARTKRLALRNGRSAPARRQAQVKSSKPIQMARLDVERAGPRLVLDYEILNGSTNELRFKASHTYYITGPVWGGNATIEGGTVIKFAPTNSPVLGLATCRTTSYQMATLTARDDNTIGETIAGSTGNPTGYYAAKAFETASGGDFKYLRICYADTGIYFADNVGTIQHCQFVKCRTALKTDNAYNEATFRNVLLHDVQVAFDGPELHVRGENVTVNVCSNLTSGTATSTLKLTNSLLVAVTNNGPFTITTGYVGTASSPADVFTAVGGGAHYLVAASPHRNSGTTNIDSTLLGELRKKTTYGPLVLSNTISISTTLSPYAQRDTDVPDLGYHYDPIDYALGWCIVTNATLTLTNGVAVATFGDPGIAVYNDAQLISHGKPERRNQICRYNTVQEQATNWGNASVGGHTMIYGLEWVSTAPIGRFRFTDFSSYANGGYHVYMADSLWVFNSLTLRDCDFNTGKLLIAGSEASRIGLTNNLFHRVDADFTFYAGLSAFNNLFKGTDCYFEKYESTNDWVFKDNSFDDTTIEDGSSDGITHDYNGYINCAVRLSPNGANDVVTNSFTYHVGPLGSYYQPTNSALVDKGSLSSAATGGFYHYTTATNALKEASSIVDIGLHYVAADYATGVPLDYDGDGWGDWFEDIDGDGSVDSGETDWQNYNSRYGVGSGPGLQVFTPLR